jgi:succinyl-CoA:acetate CoA-transferase
MADKVILEVNTWQNEKLEGMHDIYYVSDLPPHRKPIPLINPGDRIGSPYFACPPEKILAIVDTSAPDRNTPFTPPDEASKKIAGHILDFLALEVKKGRIPENLLPIQSGVGNIANAVLLGLQEGRFENLTSYTEVIQDGMIALMKTGRLVTASATAFSLSPQAVEDVNAHMDEYRGRIILRPQ